MAASSLSAALAYRIGSPRHDSRYSAIDMSVSLRASYVRANALNRESLYMIPLLVRSAVLLARDAWYKSEPSDPTRESASAHRQLDTITELRINPQRRQSAIHNQAYAKKLCFSRRHTTI